jgi:hypothetical protein
MFKKWLVGISVMAMGVVPASADTFSFVSDRLTLDPGLTPGAFLTDANVGAVDAFLAGRSVKVVKIAQDVSPATIAAIYGKYKIDYTFADFEGPGAVDRTRTLVSRIKASAGTGAAVVANQAFIGNYHFYPTVVERTAPGLPTTYANYFATGLNMATADLYPGSPSFRNPASNDSTAPNIRSALFTLPIERLTLTTLTLPAGHAHVPFVNRFNNWGNAALDTDKNPANGYQFVTTNQLPSRGDFKAQVLHYRLRGADGVQGLDGGVVGYTQQQFQADIAAGWNGTAEVREVLSDPNARPATLDTQVKSDGVLKSLEDAGVVVSGAYSELKGKLVLLVSNMDGSAHRVGAASRIGGKTVSGEFLVAAGGHQILEFGADGTRWNLVESHVVFADANRAGTGVPEPGTGAIVAGAAVVMLRRRRR